MISFKFVLFSFLFVLITATSEQEEREHLVVEKIPDNLVSTGNNTPHCPDGWNLESKINSCLYMPKFYLNWNDATNYCENVTGGELVSIYNQLEYDTVMGYGQKYSPAYPFWIGLYNRKEVSFNSYRWLDGGYYNYSKWLPGEPVDPKVNCFAFKTLDSDNGYKGVNCKYEQPFICKQHSIACPSKLYNETTGIISSPNYPDEYDNYLDCFYHITVPQGYIVNLTVLDFYSWTADYVSVYDGPSNNSFLIFQLKGYNFGDGVFFESTQNEMTLWFHTNNVLVRRGWSFNYTATLPSQANWYNASSGTLTSPNYPDNYGNNVYKRYKIVTPPDTYVQITITDFRTETNFDYLRIIDGLDLNINNTIALLTGNLNGSLPLIYNAQSNMVLMIFYSEYLLSYRGFSLDFVGMRF